MIQEHNSKKSFSETLLTYIISCKLSREKLCSRLRLSNVSASLYFDMQQPGYNPTFKNALRVAFAFNLSLEETRDLLAKARLTFSPCFKFDDLIIAYLETNYTVSKYYDLRNVDAFLYDNGVETLFS